MSSIHSSVAWVEGTLVLPQHFEQQESSLKSLFYHGKVAFQNYHWGFEEIELNKNLLPYRKIGFEKISGWFQDGTYFSFDKANLCDCVLEVEPAQKNFYVYLAIPINQLMDESRKKNTRYAIEEVEIESTLKGQQGSEKILIKKINFSLLTDSENREGYYVIPVAHIEHVSAVEGITLKETFVPACVNLRKNHVLLNMHQLMCEMIEKRQNEILAMINPAEQKRNLGSVIDLVLLQLLNKYRVKWSMLSQKNMLHPFDYFCDTNEMLGELAALQAKSFSQADIVQYNHDNCYPAFEAVLKKASQILQQDFVHRPVKATLRQINENIHTTIVDNNAFRDDVDMIISFVAEEAEIRDLIQQKIVIASMDELNDIVQFQVSGIELTELKFVPPQLPYHENRSYFKLIKEGERWECLKKTRHLGLYLEATYWEDPTVKIELWALTGAKKKMDES